MKWFLLRRFGASVLTLLAAVVIVFLGVRALPGGPAVALAGETRSPHLQEALRHEFGLDKPIPVQFYDWFMHAIHGNFGTSTNTGLSVSTTLVQRIPVTLELSILAIVIALLIGMPLGILAAVHRNSILDYFSSTTAMLGLSIPHFWLGLLLILAFAVHLGVLPASGFVPLTDPVGNLEHMIMPAFVLGIGMAAVVMRQMRSAMLDSLGADYIRTARAKGMRARTVVGVHALRNSLTTVLTVVGLQLGTLISGAVVTEQIFVIPGIGRLTIESVFKRDYTVLQAVVLIAATAYIVANFLVDIGYSLLNPRVRVGGEAV